MLSEGPECAKLYDILNLYQILSREEKTKQTYPWPPTGSLCGPADFSLTHRTSHPITATLLLQNHFALWTIHSFTVIQESL